MLSSLIDRHSPRNQWSVDGSSCTCQFLFRWLILTTDCATSNMWNGLTENYYLKRRSARAKAHRKTGIYSSRVPCQKSQTHSGFRQNFKPSIAALSLPSTISLHSALRQSQRGLCMYTCTAHAYIHITYTSDRYCVCLLYVWQNRTRTRFHLFWHRSRTDAQTIWLLSLLKYIRAYRHIVK